MFILDNLVFQKSIEKYQDIIENSIFPKINRLFKNTPQEKIISRLESQIYILILRMDLIMKMNC
jgi:hypothetical protein